MASCFLKRTLSKVHPICSYQIKRNFTAQMHIEPICNELSLSLQHLPATITESICIGMMNPSYLDSNFLHRGIHKRPQYSCGYSKDLDIITIYFHHSDPTYNDTITDLNIKHQQIILNKQTINVHSGFLNYLNNNKDTQFIDNITTELKSLKNTYNYNTSSSSNTKLMITGQSLGSALSQLFYLLMYTDCDYYHENNQCLFKDLIPSNLENVFVITFGTPSFIYCQDVEKYFKTDNINNEYKQFYDLSQRIFNFHDENDPIPLLLTGKNQYLQEKHVTFREVVRCSHIKRLEIASNHHIGNNFILLNDQCINMEETEKMRDQYLINGAQFLWNEKIRNMRQLLTLFAKNHFPHHYKNKMQKFLENYYI